MFEKQKFKSILSRININWCNKFDYKFRYIWVRWQTLNKPVEKGSVFSDAKKVKLKSQNPQHRLFHLLALLKILSSQEATTHFGSARSSFEKIPLWNWSFCFQLSFSSEKWAEASPFLFSIILLLWLKEWALLWMIKSSRHMGLCK